MSDSNRQEIFDLARKLNYFQGDFDSRLKHIAKTGAKTLVYKSPRFRAPAPTTILRTPTWSA